MKCENIYIFKFISLVLYSYGYEKLRFLENTASKIYSVYEISNMNKTIYKLLGDLDLLNRILLDRYYSSLKGKLRDLQQ